MTALRAAEVAFALAVGAGIAGFWVAVIGRAALHERAALREHSRAARAHYAAIGAAQDDPEFAPVTIEQFVFEVVSIAARLWRNEDIALDSRPDAELVSAWARSRQFWIGHGLEVRAGPSVDLLHVVNRDGDDEDRVVVRVRVRVHCKHPRLGLLGVRNARLDERWTLGRSDGRWAVLSVEGSPLSGPVLTAPLIPDRSSDTDRLVEESLAEIANAQKVGDSNDLNALVGADEPPSLALLDLSVIDDRFMPPLIAAEIAHLLESWEQAVTGSVAPLEALASAEATAALLRPGPGMRLVVRDAVLKSWSPTRLDLTRHPPAVELTVEVTAVRYVTTEDGSERFGNDSEPRQIALAWTLELTDAPQAPWRLVTSNNPAEPIPGWD